MKPPISLIPLIALLALASCGMALAQEPPQQPLLTSAENVAGEVEFGYRWVPGLNGNENVYRSIVNYGEGPKLFSGFFSFKDPKNGKFDRLDVDVRSWGGEPYNSARFAIAKDGLYSVDFSYRRIGYFNNLPSFANPFLASGYPLSQNAEDIERRMFDLNVDFRPGARISPFFSYQRSAGSGPGLTTFVGVGNEYLSNARFDDAQDVFRAGSHFNFTRWHLTLEAGGTRFRDEERDFYSGGANPGNRRTPLFGVNQFITEDRAQYKVSGDGFFGRAFGTWQPFRALDLSGQFRFSQPSLNLAYTDAATGRFVSLSNLILATGAASTGAAAALRPHPSGSLGMEFRPLPRLRILQSWYTDRFHISSNSLFTQTLTGTTSVTSGTAVPSVTLTDLDLRRFATDYNRYQIEALVDVTARLTLRGGFRRVYADASVPSALIGTGVNDLGRERSKAGLAGMDLRLRKDLSFQVEGEASSGESAYFRLSPLDSRRFKLRGRYKPRPSISVTATFGLWSGENDTPGINYGFDSKQTAVTFFFAPREGKRFSLSLEYMRSIVESSVRILVPPFFDPETSPYLQDAHSASAFLNLNLCRGVKLGMGGTLLASDGTRPTNFYQPRIELSVPLHGRVGWFTEWRYYGFREDTFRFENFTSHLLAVGLRLKL
jgi:hypothetical protein